MWGFLLWLVRAPAHVPASYSTTTVLQSVEVPCCNVWQVHVVPDLICLINATNKTRTHVRHGRSITAVLIVCAIKVISAIKITVIILGIATIVTPHPV